MDLGIAGRWALVCGASKGLGLGCAQALAHEGVNVLLVARGADTLAAAGSALRADLAARGGAGAAAQVDWVAADITTEAGRAAVLARRAEFDIVVTNAGGPPPGDYRNWTRDDWLRAVDANMLTPIELIKATVEGMVARGFGRVVNITSSAVKAPIDILGLSNGARSGLTGFIAGLARSPRLAAANVTVNNLLPGSFDTDRLRGNFENIAGKSGQTAQAVAEVRRKAIPAGRFGSAQEFGSVCAFLCSNQAAYMTGQNVLLDGGQYPGTY